MQESLVTFETAKLAKEKGFRWNTLDSFYKLTFEDIWKPNSRDKLGSFIDWNTESPSVPKDNISRPTQSLLQKWLREMHSIDIFITKVKSNYAPSVYGNNISKHAIGVTLFGKDQSYEEALEIGLKEALKLI